MAGIEKVGGRANEPRAERALDLRHQLEARRQQAPQRVFRSDRGIDRVARDSPRPASVSIVRDRSRIKHAESSAHSSGCSGGDSRVFD